MELSKINVEIREKIKEVLGVDDSKLVRMHENDLLNELLDTILLFDDEENNKLLPRIKSLTEENLQLKQRTSVLEKQILETQSNLSKKETKAEVANTNTESADDTSENVKDAAKIYEKTKKLITDFLKKELAVIENGNLESIHPKQSELEEEVLHLARENSDLNSLILDDMDLIDALMLELKNHNAEWKHSLVDKRAAKIKAFQAGYQPFGRLFIYKKLLSIPKLELTKENK